MTINGNTALNNAILHNHPRVSLFLIERGANINIMSNNGYSSLQLARQNNLTDVVIRLEEVSRRQQISQIATRLVAEVARISIRSTIRRISHSNNRNRAAIINLPGQIQSSEAQAISSLAHLPLLGVEKN